MSVQKSNLLPRVGRPHSNSLVLTARHDVSATLHSMQHQRMQASLRPSIARHCNPNDRVGVSVETRLLLPCPHSPHSNSLVSTARHNAPAASAGCKIDQRSTHMVERAKDASTPLPLTPHLSIHQPIHPSIITTIQLDLITLN